MSAERLPAEILAYYEAFSEADRLDQGAFRLELERTKAIVARHLENAGPLDIVDVGGGPGRYATWLAGHGHRVHLIDPVARHVEQAVALASHLDVRLAGATVGDARTLDDLTPARSADAALALGPLYHLTDAADRRRALESIRRTLRPGGLLFAAAISRFASTLAALAEDKLGDTQFAAIFQRDLRDGQHRNATGRLQYFTTAFFHTPDELAAEVRGAGFDLVELVAVEGPCWMLSDFDRRWADEQERARLLDVIQRIETEPSLLGVSAHLLAVARTTPSA